MGYFVIGYCYRIAEPLSDRAIVSVMSALSKYNTVMLTTAYSLLLYWAFYANESSYLMTEVRAYINPKTVAALAFSFMTNYTYTELAGVDFMFKEIAKQQMWQQYLDSGLASNLCKHYTRRTSQKPEVMRKERAERLSDIIKLIGLDGSKDEESSSATSNTSKGCCLFSCCSCCNKPPADDDNEETKV